MQILCPTNKLNITVRIHGPEDQGKRAYPIELGRLLLSQDEEVMKRYKEDLKLTPCPNDGDCSGHMKVRTDAALCRRVFSIPFSACRRM